VGYVQKNTFDLIKGDTYNNEKNSIKKQKTAFECKENLKTPFFQKY
jgi:hypothetical protein